MEILALVVGVPAVLMASLLALDWLEAAVVTPGERAAELYSLIESPKGPEEVEHAAAELLADVVPFHERPSSQAA